MFYVERLNSTSIAQIVGYIEVLLNILLLLRFELPVKVVTDVHMVTGTDGMKSFPRHGGVLMVTIDTLFWLGLLNFSLPYFALVYY